MGNRGFSIPRKHCTVGCHLLLGPMVTGDKVRASCKEVVKEVAPLPGLWGDTLQNIVVHWLKHKEN